MTIVNLVNTFEGGSNGTAITGGNSGGASGDAFTAVTANCAFSSAQKMHGSLSMVITNPAATSATARWAIASQTKVAARQYVYLTSLPGADLWLYKTQSTTATAAALRVQGTNKLRLATNGVDRWTAAAAISATTWYRTEVFLDAGTSNVTGKYQVAYYAGDSTSAIEDSGLITGQDVASTPFINTYHGFSGGTSYSGTIYIDDIAVTSGASGDTVGLIGPVAAATSPVVTPGTTQYIDPGTCNLTASGTISGDTFSGGTWTFLSSNNGDIAPPGTTTNTGAGTTANTSTASVTLQPGVYVFRNTMTGVGGGSATGSTTVYVAALSAVAVKPAAHTGTWTKVGAASTDVSTVTDGLDTTYMESGAAPVNSADRWQLQPCRAGSITVRLRCAQNPTSPVVTVNVKIYKEDGTTLVATGSATNAPTTPGWVPFIFDNSVLTAITGVDDQATRALRRALYLDPIANQ